MAVHADLEEGDGIPELLQGRIQSRGGAEGAPSVPMIFGGCGARRNDSATDVFRTKAKVTAEENCLMGVHKTQGFVC